MTGAQVEARNKLTDRGLVYYFVRFSQENARFIIEGQIASEVVDIIDSKEKLTRLDFENIVKCFNQIVGKEHHDGSGWHDFKLRLGWFFRVFGYQAWFDVQTNELTIAKAGWLKLIKWRWQSVFNYYH
ncbi:hypothetical protein GCM10027594_17610 [Hymenobacter agri]